MYGTKNLSACFLFNLFASFMENVLNNYNPFPKQGNMRLDRQKALDLLHEILDVTKQADITAISINPDGSGDFSLKINCMDEQVKNSIQPIIARDKLAMKSEKGLLTIYSPKP